MEELHELRDHLEHQRYAEAIDLVTEMEEMSKEDKINKMRSFAKILLLHIIKQHAEQRSTRSWERSICNAIDEITTINRRRKAKGHYLGAEELSEVIAEAWVPALKLASFEAFDGEYDERELAAKVDRAAIEQQALGMLQQPYNELEHF